MTTLLNNRYQIIQVLGAGGFGQTFLAEDAHMPSRRRCVIKQLKPVTTDPQLYQVIQQRFGREAATLETLGEGSDQIPKLYAYFSEQGQFYLVQEWIQGQTICDRVAAEGPLNETVVQEILISLLQVLQYVHSKGIIYRDIKPDNIILRQLNNQPVLIDFGAVKETMVTAINAKGKTHTIAIGTPGFMAPEQAAGRPTYASDIYGLGMTAIYLLTGKLPQELEVSQNEQVLWQQHAPKVSSSLAAAIDKAIQYSPRDRYTTARKMLDDLLCSVSVSPPQKTTQATLILSPPHSQASSKSALESSPSTVALNESSSRQTNKQRNLILGGLLAGGLLSAAVVFNLINNQSPRLASEQPVATSMPVATPQLDTEPTPTPSLPATVDSPTLTESTPTPTATPQAATEPTPTPSVPATVDSPTPTNESTPTQTQQQNTQNSPTPVPETPQQQNDDRANNTTTNGVPGFPIGTAETQVKTKLGNPTQTSRGVWGNTRAYIYELEPNRITLGYLFDRASNRLRQTEVSFAQSVSPEVMQATLQEMLGDRSIDKANQGLQQVYQRQTNRYTFNVGELEGAIERNDRDRIYIGIWDADLH
jgi:serine/threonine-protein kinase